MTKDQLEDALARGRKHAEAIVQARRAAKGPPKPFGGYLIAEGDSWFDYPLYDEITEKLEDDYNYRIESAASWGDTADNMLYTEGKDGKKLVKKFEKLKDEGRVPRAILLSCGGNDIAGDRFSVFLGHARSPHPGLDVPVVDAVFARLADTIVGLVGALKELGLQSFKKDIPVVIHGYGYAVPDGRGFLRTSIFSGPWLAPSFDEKGYDTLAARLPIVTTLIDRFNAMQQNIAANVPKVAYVNARPVLSSSLVNDEYKRSWANEIHPTDDGFGAVATLFHTAIQQFPLP